MLRNGRSGRLFSGASYLFAGSDAGGERAAAVYSQIGSAKLNGLDPEASLRFVLERIADYPSIGPLTSCLGRSPPDLASVR